MLASVVYGNFFNKFSQLDVFCYGAQCSSKRPQKKKSRGPGQTPVAAGRRQKTVRSSSFFFISMGVKLLVVVGAADVFRPSVTSDFIIHNVRVIIYEYIYMIRCALYAHCDDNTTNSDIILCRYYAGIVGTRAKTK